MLRRGGLRYGAGTTFLTGPLSFRSSALHHQELQSRRLRFASTCSL